MLKLEHRWGRTRPATLRDVAQLAGVGVSAVSVVLNGSRSGTRVSIKTRAAILEAAESLNYRPNGLAQSLVSGRTGRIGVYSGVTRLDARNIFYAEILGGVLEGCFESGLNMVVHATGSKDSDLLDLVSSRSIDGLVVHLAPGDPLEHILEELKVPAIAVVDTVSGIPVVAVDDEQGGRLQAEHLLGLGHRKVIYRQAHLGYESAKCREEAFLACAAMHGMQVIPTRFAYHPPIGLSEVELRLLHSSDPPTAIVAWEDSVAFRTCEALEKAGFSVGKQVSVVGFNGIRPAVAPRHNLTTIEAPWYGIGRTSVELLCALLAGKPVSSITCLPVELLPAATSGPAPRHSGPSSDLPVSPRWTDLAFQRKS